jgi:filamentous hemagglutinin family protein
MRPGVGYAAPAGGVVTGGGATITTAGKTTTITQDTAKAIIDWNSFNIAADEKVQFVQPSSSSVALNRIHDGNATEILGSLTANGQVYLVNPNGVFFGKGSQIDVAGLVATTANISNTDFMAENYNLHFPEFYVLCIAARRATRDERAHPLAVAC